MKIFKQAAKALALNRKQEQAIYALVLEEIQNEKKIAGLWAMALSESGGDIGRAESIYISLRVQDVKDDSVLLEGIVDAPSENGLGRVEQQVKDDVNPLINELDAMGYTPLMRAVVASTPSEVKRLISEGADPNVKNSVSRNLSALDLARQGLRERKKWELMDGWSREPDDATVGYEEIRAILGKITSRS